MEKSWYSSLRGTPSAWLTVEQDTWRAICNCMPRAEQRAQSWSGHSLRHLSLSLLVGWGHGDLVIGSYCKPALSREAGGTCACCVGLPIIQACPHGFGCGSDSLPFLHTILGIYLLVFGREALQILWLRCTETSCNYGSIAMGLPTSLCSLPAGPIVSQSHQRTEGCRFLTISNK